jgi:hypothetical protein
MEITDSFFGGSPNYGALGQRSEKKRQKIIDLGLNQINAVYGGGTAPFYTMANGNDGTKFDPHSSYYSLTGKGFQPYWMPGGKKPGSQFQNSEAGSNAGFAAGIVSGIPFSELLGSKFLGGLFGKTESPRDIARKAFRRGQLFNAPENKTFKGYTPEFYAAREKAYTENALPQLADQYQSARNSTIYGLSDAGLSGSTVGDQARYRLERAMNAGRQNVADEAINQGNQLRDQVEQSRQRAIQQLYQTGDPTQALKGAISSSAGFERPSTFGALANGFGDVMNQYYIQRLLQGYQNQTNAASGVGGGGSPTYFAPTV